MTWPFRSTREQVLERDVALLQARIRDLEASLEKAKADEQYFRGRYDRLADQVLFARGEIVAPVHTDTVKAETEPAMGHRIARAAGLIGNIGGVSLKPKVQHHASAAELPR